MCQGKWRKLNVRYFGLNNETNEITGFTPLMDHNLSLVADLGHEEVDELIYDPTNCTMLESAVRYYDRANIRFRELPAQCRDRLEKVKDLAAKRRELGQERECASVSDPAAEQAAMEAVVADQEEYEHRGEDQEEQDHLPGSREQQGAGGNR
jgi:hypothetical protein